MGAGQARGALDVGRVGVGSGEGDVAADAVVEQERVLEHDADGVTQLAQRQIAEVDAVEADRALLDVVEARQQPGDRRLATAGRADQRDAGARLDGQVEAAQHRCGRVVSEVHVIEAHAADRRAARTGLRQVDGSRRIGDFWHCGQHLVDAQQGRRGPLTEGNRHAQVAQRKHEQRDVLHELEHLPVAHLAVEHAVPTDAQHGDHAQVRQQVERRQERAADLRRVERDASDVVGLDAQLVGLHLLGTEPLDHPNAADALLDDGGELRLLDLHRQHRRMDAVREALRQQVDDRQRRQGDEREQRLRREQHHDDRGDHRQVGRSDRDHHDEALDLLQIARRAAHQLPGLRVIVEADVQSHDVREQLLAQSGLGHPALAKGEQAPPSREDSSDHCGSGDEAGPEPQ